MAKILESDIPPRGNCDWDEIMDGKPRELKKGVDFHSTVNSFRNKAYVVSRRAGKSVTVRIIDESTVHVQARDL